MLVSSVKEFPHLDSFVDNYANDWREAKFSLTFYLRVDYTVMFCFTNFNEFFKSFKELLGGSQTLMIDLFLKMFSHLKLLIAFEKTSIICV